ncbi:MAG: hypothetical protein WA057_00120, partial [Candidatus Magasanikiibacteriota bacterium]
SIYFQKKGNLGNDEIDKKLRSALKKQNFKAFGSLLDKKLKKTLNEFNKAKQSIINSALYFVRIQEWEENFEQGIKYADIIIDNELKGNGIFEYTCFRKAFFCVKLGRKDDALACINKSLKMSPELNIAAQRFIAAIHYYFDDTAKAKSILDDLITLLLSRPDTADSHLLELSNEFRSFKDKPFNTAILALYKAKYHFCLEMNLIKEAEIAKADFNDSFGVSQDHHLPPDFTEIKDWLEMDKVSKDVKRIFNKECMLYQVKCLWDIVNEPLLNTSNFKWNNFHEPYK